MKFLPDCLGFRPDLVIFFQLYFVWQLFQILPKHLLSKILFSHQWLLWSLNASQICTALTWEKGNFENTKVKNCDFSTISVPIDYNFLNSTIPWGHKICTIGGSPCNWFQVQTSISLLVQRRYKINSEGKNVRSADLFLPNFFS